MTTVQAYRRLRSSGLQWIPEIPEHWRVVPSWAIARQVRRSPTTGDGIVTAFRDGQVTLRAKRRTDGFTEAIQEHGYQGVRRGELVIHSMDGFAGAIGVSDSDGKMSPVAHIYSVRDGEPRYFALLLRVMALGGFVESLAKGIRERSTAFDRATFKSLSLPVPPLEEQRSILAYLDRETAQIDAFIAKNEELIALLTERRAAVIGRAVTRGLSEVAPLSSDGPEWIGQVPAAWSVRPIKAEYTVVVGKMLNESKSEGDLVPYVRAANIQPHGLDLSDIKEMKATVPERTSLALRAGDVVFVEGGGGYGRSDFLTEDLAGWVFQNHVIRLRPRRGHDGRFLNYWLQHVRMIGHYEALSAFATIPNVSGDKLGRIEMPVPPLEEQRRLVEYIDGATKRIDDAINVARRGVEFAKERRAALISAAVTGKIDVRGAA
ncbi:restriction endonuclease subunit S [Microbacterium paraoxydans]|uniref:restriction endonuclease subunit S n=1 Tax=Microbacterium paraoxydans TaxID=199592 RepID=UPI003D74A5CC